MFAAFLNRYNHYDIYLSGYDRDYVINTAIYELISEMNGRGKAILYQTIPDTNKFAITVSYTFSKNIVRDIIIYGNLYSKTKNNRKEYIVEIYAERIGG